VTIEHQEGLDTDHVLIINRGRVFFGDVEKNGYFNAYGLNGSMWAAKPVNYEPPLLACNRWKLNKTRNS